MSNVIDNATVSSQAWVGTKATVSGHAQVSGRAHVSGSATISGDAQVSGDAYIGGNATVSGNVKIGGSARVRGTAVITEQKHVAWGNFTARSGRYTLTIYVQADGSVGFTWGCREGTDLRAYLAANPDYATKGLDFAPLEFLEAFEKNNQVNKRKGCLE